MTLNNAIDNSVYNYQITPLHNCLVCFFLVLTRQDPRVHSSLSLISMLELLSSTTS